MFGIDASHIILAVVAAVAVTMFWWANPGKLAKLKAIAKEAAGDEVAKLNELIAGLRERLAALEAVTKPNPTAEAPPDMPEGMTAVMGAFSAGASSVHPDDLIGGKIAKEVWQRWIKSARAWLAHWKRDGRWPDFVAASDLWLAHCIAQEVDAPSFADIPKPPLP